MPIRIFCTISFSDDEEAEKQRKGSRGGDPFDPLGQDGGSERGEEEEEEEDFDEDDYYEDHEVEDLATFLEGCSLHITKPACT
ncbi:UNVERIFIED_CONTAM: hypothetical protein FKN15_063679 [Acipenser sinensis]